ncbi:MAG: alkaline phosphatase family protein [Thermodesulfovibrionales bacterium]|nr:alkaline phosphatase family protein [Thermodesulfovibrionales bacterium]
MLNFHQKKKKKVVILGIDGVPCSLLRNLVSRGIMPNLASLVHEGALSEMTASIPEVSSTSWTTFMTGVNPGKHNIYGFMDLRKGSYEYRFPNSHDIKSDPIWEIIGRHNKRSIVINVPSTYPARPLNGILTAGFVALDLRKATFPESAYQYLQNIDYRMDVDTKKASQSLEAFAEDIDQTFRTREKALLHFFDNEEWDLFIGTITETDRLHHFFWSAYEDDAHAMHRFFIDFYKKIDALIGAMAQRCDKNTAFMIVSDHGFAAIKQELYLNAWLREERLLKFRKEPPESLSDIHPESKAFALDPSRIYINLETRYPSGSVKKEDYESIRALIKDSLQKLSIDGEKVVKEIFFKEDIYIGPHFESGPDLVALPHRGYDLKGSLNKNVLFGRSIFTGAHTRDDATFFLNRHLNIQKVNIMDVAPTVFELMGIEYNACDGKSVLYG